MVRKNIKSTEMKSQQQRWAAALDGGVGAAQGGKM